MKKNIIPALRTAAFCALGTAAFILLIAEADTPWHTLCAKLAALASVIAAYAIRPRNLGD